MYLSEPELHEFLEFPEFAFKFWKFFNSTNSGSDKILRQTDRYTGYIPSLLHSPKANIRMFAFVTTDIVCNSYFPIYQYIVNLEQQLT